MKYRLIAEQRRFHRVEKMARTLGVSRAGYYEWRRRREAGRHTSDQHLVDGIRAIQERVRYR